MNTCTIILLLAVWLHTTTAIVCPQNYCDTVKCVNIGECPENSLKIPKSSFCGCCDTCVNTL
ncbi:hypothetical protein L9F63_013398, partial [Diploptera punctata]